MVAAVKHLLSDSLAEKDKSHCHAFPFLEITKLYTLDFTGQNIFLFLFILSFYAPMIKMETGKGLPWASWPIEQNGNLKFTSNAYYSYDKL